MALPLPRRASLAAAAAPTRLPLLLWLALGSTFVACLLGERRVLFFNVKGWMWVVPFVVAAYDVVGRRIPRPFPVEIWAPWALYAGLSLLTSPFANATQRTAMMLAPVAMGYACSGLRLGPEGLAELQRRLRQFAVLLLALMLLRVGALRELALPGATGLAPQSITAALLSVYLAAGYACNVPGSLAAWGASALLPVVALTRTAIVAAGLSLPATFAPLGLRRRAAALALVALAGTAVFASERFQQKMFHTGSGGIVDLHPDNPNLRSTGRFPLWEAMREQIARKPLFGHGANAQEDFIQHLLGQRGQPHNDWLRIAFDYGWVGVALYAATLLLQAGLLLRRAVRASPRRGPEVVLSAAGAGSFAVYAAIMLTDNVLLYVSYFGMLQFALVGVAYAVRAGPEGAR